MANTLRWLVLGPGAIGGWIAKSLLDQQQDIRFLPRHPDDDPITWQFQQDSQINTYETRCYQHDWQPDAVIVAVKAYDVNPALARLQQLPILPDCPAIVSHNGMIERTDSRPQYSLITTHGAYRSGNTIVHSGRGESWLSRRADNQETILTDNIAEVLSQALAPLNWVSDIQPMRWQKLLINCVINPLTACHGLDNGQLAEPQWRPTVQRLINEFVKVAEAVGMNMPLANATAAVDSVIAKTAANRSSMRMDIENGRPTEIEALSGYLVSQARSLGIAVPTHQALLDKVRRLSG